MTFGLFEGEMNRKWSTKNLLCAAVCGELYQDLKIGKKKPELEG